MCVQNSHNTAQIDNWQKYFNMRFGIVKMKPDSNFHDIMHLMEGI